MSSPTSPGKVPLGADHPCYDCSVRERAVCADLESAELGAFRGLGRALRMRPGQTIFHQGDPASRVFTVTSGTVKLYTLLPDGRRQVTGFAFPGSFLGLGLEQDHAVTAEALDEVELCAFPRNRFRAFVEARPGMERRLYGLAARELGDAREQLVSLGRKAAPERLATFFLQCLGRVKACGDVPPVCFDLPMSRADIADHLGLTKETVSRLIGRFRTLGLIRLVTLNRLEVLDRARLARLAEGHGGGERAIRSLL